MKIPSKLQINGYLWRVVREKLDEKVLGLTIHESRLIHISNSLHGKELATVFLHELVHACLGVESQYYLSHDKEELLANLLAPRLLEVLRQVRGWR